MNAQAAEIREEARLWVIRTHDPAFADWAELTEWLEGDPAHLAAYEAALDDDVWAAELLASAPCPAPVSVTSPNRRWFLGAGIAASIVAVAAGWVAFDRGGGHEIITGPGEHRTVQLADGSRVILNGSTRITFDPDRPRRVALAAGEALFEVQHNARDPFVVTVGATRLVDAGTVFNVARDGGAVDVAVAHGAVIYQPGTGEIRLEAGDALYRSSQTAEPVLRKGSPQAIGSWQSGVLQYTNAPLDRIAWDLRRNLDVKIGTGPDAGKLRFTGSLAVDGPPEEVFARIGPLLGVNFMPDGAGWMMAPADGSAR